VGFWSGELIERAFRSILQSIDTSVKPKADNTYDIGDSSLRWRRLYAVETYTSLMSLD